MRECKEITIEDIVKELRSLRRALRKANRLIEEIKEELMALKEALAFPKEKDFDEIIKAVKKII